MENILQGTSHDSEKNVHKIITTAGEIHSLCDASSVYCVSKRAVSKAVYYARYLLFTVFFVITFESTALVSILLSVTDDAGDAHHRY